MARPFYEVGDSGRPSRYEEKAEAIQPGPRGLGLLMNWSRETIGSTTDLTSLVRRIERTPDSSRPSGMSNVVLVPAEPIVRAKPNFAVMRDVE